MAGTGVQFGDMAVGPAGRIKYLNIFALSDERVRSGAYRTRGSRIVNSLYSPSLLSTAMLPPC